MTKTHVVLDLNVLMKSITMYNGQANLCEVKMKQIDFKSNNFYTLTLLCLIFKFISFCYTKNDNSL